MLKTFVTFLVSFILGVVTVENCPVIHKFTRNLCFYQCDRCCDCDCNCDCVDCNCDCVDCNCRR